MKKIVWYYSGLLLIGLFSFFFVMKFFGLYTNVNLRVLNIIIHGSVVYFAMKAFRKTQSGSFNFLEVFMVGFRTSIVPVLVFAFFQFIYLQFLNPQFFDYIQETAIMGSMLSPLKASIFLVFEGLGVAMLTAYVGMRTLTIQENVPSVSEL